MMDDIYEFQNTKESCESEVERLKKKIVQMTTTTKEQNEKIEKLRIEVNDTPMYLFEFYCFTVDSSPFSFPASDYRCLVEKTFIS